MSVSVRGNPVHAPRVVTVRLIISKLARWTIVITDAHGTALWRTSGTGRVAQLSWDGQQALAGTAVRVPVPPQQVTWSASATAGRDRAPGRRGAISVGLPSVPPSPGVPAAPH